MAIYPDKKNGKLTGRFRVEVQYQGRRMRGRFNTLAEAKQKEQEFLKTLQEAPQQGLEPLEGLPAIKPRHDTRGAPRTLLEALEKVPSTFWSKSMVETGPAHVRAVVEAMGGDKLLKDLKTEDFDQVPENLLCTGRKGKRTPATVNRHLSSTRQLLKWCLKRGYIDQLPSLEVLDEDEGRIRWLTYEEEARLLELLHSYGAHDVAYFCVFAVETGMRRSEILNLEPQDVQGDWAHLWKTKTSNPRSVPLSPRAKDALEAVGISLFQKLSIHRLRYYWDKAKADMGLDSDPWFVVHALRHTRATRMVQQGTNLLVIQKLLGHKTIVTTKRYAHVSDDVLLAAVMAPQDPKLPEVQFPSGKIQRGLGGGGSGGGNPSMFPESSPRDLHCG